MRLFRTSILFMLLAFSIQLHAAIGVNSTPENPTIYGTEIRSIEDFINISPKQIRNEEGKKLSLKERIVLKVVQKRAKKALKKGKAFDAQQEMELFNGSFNLGGFLLGFFFSIIGILIALLFGNSAVKSALIGFLISLVILGVIFLAM